MPRYLATTLAVCAVVVTLCIAYGTLAAARAVRWRHIESGVVLDTWKGRLCDPVSGRCFRQFGHELDVQETPKKLPWDTTSAQ